jgi:hypothetical protein
MYSAYVQSMTLMFHYLFGDANYAAEGALTMRLQPLFWGAVGQHFPYDECKLNEHLYWTMVQKGYLGFRNRRTASRARSRGRGRSARAWPPS